LSAHHGHSHTPKQFDRAFAVGIALNVSFLSIEAFYGWKADSLALLADAGHNLSDVAGLALAWGGAWAGRVRPNARHTYGWKRASILAAFANAVLLLLAMGSLAWEALTRLGHPSEPHGTTIMAVAAVGVVINSFTALMFMRGRESDLNIQGAFAHMAADALVSLGVVASGALQLWKGWTWLDPVMSLIIVVVIVAGTWGLFRQSLHLISDGVPAEIDLEAVREYLRSLPGVVEVHDLHVWALSTADFALTAHLEMPQGNSDDAFLQQACQGLHDQFEIRHVTIQVERAPFCQPCDARGCHPVDLH
jgi:cobalt-zinc-cadmium efflux system protein